MYQAPPGTFDVLPGGPGPFDSRRYEALIGLFRQRAGRAGYGLYVGPMFEEVGVFERVGESTDIVRKEMYDFDDKGGRRIALRPDGTAPVARAFIQHRPTTPWKVWYVTPKFRYERPQAGRYRQHHELGLEVIGSHDPDLDVEVIALAAGLYRDLGLRRVRLTATSLGDAICRPAYRAELLAFLEARRGQLCPEHQDRYGENPLRVLDCKRPACLEATSDAPRMLDRLCEACTAHFARVRAGLEALGVAYELAPRLVRGLDYYTRTTFEFVADALDTAQNGAGGGGRYDGLVESLGGPPEPGIGFGLGIERILLACDAEGVFGAEASHLDVFVVDVTGGEHARDITQELRLAGVRADRAFDARSMKAQLKAADRSGARLAVIVGDAEVEAGTVAIRDLRSGGEQDAVDRSLVVKQVQERLDR